jgi:hypothetical protein
MLNTNGKMYFCPTESLRRLVIKKLVALGCKYIIGWRDVQGLGVYGIRKVDWQTDKSAPYINTRH